MKVFEQKGLKQKRSHTSIQQQQQQEDELGVSDSDEQQRKRQEIQKLQIIQHIKKKENERDFIVNANFSFDITDYFKFEQKQDPQRQKTFFKYLSQKNYIAWLILLYSVLTTAMIPPWLMSIKANKLLRISWRCLLQLVIIVPFVLYQYRSASEKTLQMYKLSHIFNPKHIQKIIIAAFMATFWVTTILTTIQWTYISHSMILGSLANFFLSIQRTFKRKNGYMEQGGQIMIIFGIILVIYDSASLIISDVPKEKYNVYNPFYLTRQWWQRVLGDIGALTVGYCMSQLSKQTSDLKVFYPPYLAMLLTNILTCIFCIFSAFFFNGVTFDFNPQNGVFGLFNQSHFANFLYMSIILGLGVFISFVMVSKMFPDPVVPALAMTLQPVISTVLFQVVGVQTMPGPFSCLGYIFIIPGVIVILMGSCMFTRFTDVNLAKKIRQQDLQQKIKKFLNKKR